MHICTRSFIAFSVILFADDIEHVKKILQDLLLFRNECQKIYNDSSAKNGVHFSPEKYTCCVDLENVLNDDADSDSELTITPIQLNQGFKVGWAANDTIG